MTSENLERVKQLRIPVETCFSCHQRAYDTPYAKNVFGSLRHSNNVALATDNPSFYQITLSREYELCFQSFGLTAVELFSLARRAIDFAFCSSDIKERLRRQFDNKKIELSKRFKLTL